jgi:hypothetical protein
MWGIGLARECCRFVPQASKGMPCCWERPSGWYPFLPTWSSMSWKMFCLSARCSNGFPRSELLMTSRLICLSGPSLLGCKGTRPVACCVLVESVELVLCCPSLRPS